MPYEFILLGTILLIDVFFVKPFKNKYLITVSIACMLVSYFIDAFICKNVGINVINIFSLMLLIMYFILNIRQIRFAKCVMLIFIIVGLYILLNFYSMDFNTYFSYTPLIITISAIFIGSRMSFIEGEMVAVLSVVSVDIFNVLYMVDKVGYMALFDRDYVLCIVLINMISICIVFIKDKIRGIRYEKVY